MKSNFLKELQDRGFLNQCTDIDALDRYASKSKLIGYIGFDCTAESLHVGSLLQIMILRLMQKHGHQPIILLGGGTTLIGDPSGKDATRKILNSKDIKKNIIGIKQNFKNLLNFNNKKTIPIFVDNFKWLGKLNYINFLRDVGSQFTINKMLSFDSVKLRLDREQSLSYMEFNYMILQAYDFYKLNKKFNCVMQLGGSDQWGNIINGVELVRKLNKKIVYGLTSPLITTASGSKMGKTEKGAVWLNKKKFSSYDYWQFWRNTEDNDVIKFLKFFTDIDIDLIEKLKNTENDINNLKIILANEATKLLHGKKAADSAAQTALETFKLGKMGKELPKIILKESMITNGINILDFICDNKILASKSEARRAIENNAIKINDELVLDYKTNLTKNILDKSGSFKISFGKKKFFLVKII